MSFSSQFCLSDITKLCVFMVGICSYNCVETKKDTSFHQKTKLEKPEVTEAESFNNLVIVDSLGVTGADGVISFPLSNGTDLFMMGDSFISPVKNGKRDPKSAMLNNTFIVVDAKHNKSAYIIGGTKENPKALLWPAHHESTKEYYWPGHGLELDDAYHVFMSKFKKEKEGIWGFAYIGTDYLRLEKETCHVMSQDDFPYSVENGVHYGHALLHDNNYIYVYGSQVVDGKSTLHVTRGRLDPVSKRLTNFTFYNTQDWVKHSKDSKPLKGIIRQVPEQFSVFKYKETYVLLFQDRDLKSGNIFSYVSNSPVGPWTNEKLVYHSLEQELYKKDKVFTYNAMAHSQHIKNNKLLISYCVNSLELTKIFENVNYYRPRFLWVPMEMILK